MSSTAEIIAVTVNWETIDITRNMGPCGHSSGATQTDPLIFVHSIGHHSDSLMTDDHLFSVLWRPDFKFRLWNNDAAMRTLLLLVIAVLLAAVAAQSVQIVNTTYGQVKGKTVPLDDGTLIDVWYGIPYAKPPVGDFRFEVYFSYHALTHET
jgi:Carboxylesterase family